MGRKEDIVLIGGGGHCRSCIDVIEQQGVYSILGIVDLPENIGNNILGYEVIASDDDLPGMVKQYRNFLVTIGQVKSSSTRERIFTTVRAGGGEVPLIISPLAYVSPHARVGEGTIIMHQAIINASACIGRNCIVNTKALVEHDAVVGDHCHISTGSIVNGGVVINSGTFFGSGAVSKENVTIGAAAVIGCNATVKRDIGS